MLCALLKSKHYNKVLTIFYYNNYVTSFLYIIKDKGKAIL